MSAAFQHILLVEDELHLGIALEVALKPHAARLSRAKRLSEARDQIALDSPDLIVLDRGLPDGDGLDLCGELRQANFTGSIFVLTAAGEVNDRVTGFRSGADDYLGKPFSWDELEGRILALARRQRAHAPAASPSTVTWTLDAPRLRILGPRGWEELTPLEFRLAEKLIHAEGAIISREDLLREVWGFTLVPQTRTVDHFLGRLRKRFEENTDLPRHFLTVRGAGYRFSRG